MELCIQKSIFEGDSEVVCNALFAADFHHSSVGPFVKDIVSIVFASSPRTFSFSHTRQQGNFVTHTLAKRARLYLPLLV